MKNERLLDAIGRIDDEFIEEADPEKAKLTGKHNIYSPWMKWVAAAACVVIVAGVAIPVLLPQQKSDQTTEAEAGTETEMSEDSPAESADVTEESAAETPAGQGYFNGKVLEVNEETVYVECTENFLGEITVGSKVEVPLEHLSSEDNPEMKTGDNIRVLYIGEVAGKQVLKIENTVSIFMLDDNGEILYAVAKAENEEPEEAVDVEPLQEITLEKAKDIELFPTEMLDGYVPDGVVEVYDKKVVVARFYNAELDDMLTIRIYNKEYFDSPNNDVELNSIIYQGESSSFIYLEGEKKIIRYEFSNSDIAKHNGFFDMVYSADFFRNGNVPVIKEN